MAMQGKLNTVCRGKQEYLTCYTCYNLFTAGGVYLQGEFFISYHRLSSSKRGRMLKPTKLNNFDDGQAFMITQPQLKPVEAYGYFWIFLCNFRIL